MYLSKAGNGKEVSGPTGPELLPKHSAKSNFFKTTIMKRTNLLLIAFLFLSCWRSFAQEVKVIYQVEEEQGQYRLSLRMQSMSEAAVEIRGVNFSLALPAGCEVMTREGSAFETAWTDYLLQEVQQQKLSLNYEGQAYDHRWQFGLADPLLPVTESIQLPAASEEALPVMKLQLKGTCATGLYLEHVSENPVNQIGGADFKPLPYVIEQVGRHAAPADLVKEPSFQTYPNPVVDKLSIDLSAPADGEFKIELTDLTGRLLFSQEQTVESGVVYTLSMNLETYAQGTYFVRLIDLAAGQTVKTTKVVKR